MCVYEFVIAYESFYMGEGWSVNIWEKPIYAEDINGNNEISKLIFEEVDDNTSINTGEYSVPPNSVLFRVHKNFH